MKLVGRVLLRQSTESLLSCRLAFFVLKDPRARFSCWRLSTIWFHADCGPCSAALRRSTARKRQLQLNSGRQSRITQRGSGTSCAVRGYPHTCMGFVNLYFPSLFTPELCPLATVEPASAPTHFATYFSSNGPCRGSWPPRGSGKPRAFYPAGILNREAKLVHSVPLPSALKCQRLKLLIHSHRYWPSRLCTNASFPEVNQFPRCSRS